MDSNRVVTSSATMRRQPCWAQVEAEKLRRRAELAMLEHEEAAKNQRAQDLVAARVAEEAARVARIAAEERVTDKKTKAAAKAAAAAAAAAEKKRHAEAAEERQRLKKHKRDCDAQRKEERARAKEARMHNKAAATAGAYLLRTTSCLHSYIGANTDVAKRRDEHNGLRAGGAHYTAEHEPGTWEVALFWPTTTCAHPWKSASSLEGQLKHRFGLKRGDGRPRTNPRGCGGEAGDLERAHPEVQAVKCRFCQEPHWIAPVRGVWLDSGSGNVLGGA